MQEYSLSSQLESTDVYFMVYPDGTVLAIPPLHNKVGPGPVIVHQGKKYKYSYNNNNDNNNKNNNNIK